MTPEEQQQVNADQPTGDSMEPSKQVVDPFAYALMEQRNNALNEAAYWRAQATQFQAQVMQLEAAAKPKEEEKKA